jgi:transcriptional regulator with XRE-family HTH domain
MKSLENLGRLVQEKRGSRGIRAVAKEIGISHATLSRVERGFLPDLENYRKICKWLGVSTNPIPDANHQESKRSVPQVHFRKQATVSPETAQALAQLILTAQNALRSQQETD